MNRKVYVREQLQGVGGGLDQEIWIRRCKLLYIEMDKQGPIVQHSELYSMSYKTIMEKNMKKYIYD